MTARVAPQWSLGILAGGDSRRMGRDKACAPFLGRTMIEHVIARQAPTGVPVLVSAKVTSPPPPAGTRRVDDLGESIGPLGGIASLLEASVTPLVLVTPCDLPNFPPAAGDGMLRYMRGSDAVLVESGGRREPFPALLSTEIAPLIRALIASGERRADSFHDRVRATIVPFSVLFPGEDPAVSLLNVNDPGALLTAENWARNRASEG